MKKQSTRSKGLEAESRAARILERGGYRIIERNYRSPFGEIDLIARHGRALCFIEVKSLGGRRFGVPQAAVDARKRRRLSRSAIHYIQSHSIGPREMRFDVVALWREGGRWRHEVLTDAFEFSLG